MSCDADNKFCVVFFVIHFIPLHLEDEISTQEGYNNFQSVICMQHAVWHSSNNYDCFRYLSLFM